MKRHFIFAVLLLASVLAISVNAAVFHAETAPHIKIVIDGVVQTLTDATGNRVDPVIIDGTAYLPVRSMANAFGKDVAWDEKTSTITIGTGIAVKPTDAPLPASQTKIGVSMPTELLQRWVQDGDSLKKQLEAKGYAVDLQYTDNEVETQISQIENMIDEDCKVIVIAAISWDSFSSVLAKAKSKGIAVIAYDRLIRDTDAVTYYATFDNYMVGTVQGEYIKKALDLDKAAGSFNIEIFAGAPDDTNALKFYQGAIDVLDPYIKSGKLTVASGQTTFEQVATADWSTEKAQARMDSIILDNYSKGKKLDAVLCSNDSTAQGVTNALLAAGFTKNNFPIITGQDCDITSVKNMLEGYQSMSVFKDTRTLAAKTVEMVDAIVKGTEVPVNDTTTYDNGKGILSTFLCPPTFATVDNYKEILIDSGYYMEYELK